ncbi:hypothetical protein E2562_023919 [Oryza meyeriana var. granulata]|uniref:Uncharacterized protein n=1 Tax=Oryza meyeriana var. granulata TaxID=110450 RepID=A0A6G1BZY8_9ORYZ|nr:hypothetical protein E2562_023919 [Oryza meyeriana var. granulata]
MLLICSATSSPVFSSFGGREGEEEVVLDMDMEASMVQCAANYVPLTPLSFIERAATVYGDRTALVFGEKQ